MPVDTMSVKEQAQELRSALKAMGYTSKQVSVRTKRSIYDDIIYITIKDLSVSKKKIAEVANKYKCIRWDDYTNEILAGGNTYVDISFDWEILNTEVKKRIKDARALMKKYQNVEPGVGVIFRENESIRAVYFPQWFNCHAPHICIEDKDGNVIARWDARSEYNIAECLVMLDFNQF